MTTPNAQTTGNHPREVCWVSDLPTAGALGTASAHGRRGFDGVGTVLWRRDLQTNLERLRDRHAIARVRRAQPASVETSLQAWTVERFVERNA